MTVCAGAICEEGKVVVVAADRMVTFGAPLNLQANLQGEKKVISLTPSAAILFAGSVPDGEEIVRKVQAQTAGLQKPSILQIAEIVKRQYIDLKRKRVEDTILRPYLGLDFPAFQGLAGSSSSSQILQQVLGIVAQHNLQLDLLIAGVDDTGGHLYIITHPGTDMQIDMIGYGSIGSGGLHTSIGLALSRQSKLCSLPETLYNVFQAKKAAEVAPGVGKETDMMVIHNGKSIPVKENTIKHLEKLIKEKPGLSDNELKELQAECKGYVTA